MKQRKNATVKDQYGRCKTCAYSIKSGGRLRCHRGAPSYREGRYGEWPRVPASKVCGEYRSGEVFSVTKIEMTRAKPSYIRNGGDS